MNEDYINEIFGNLKYINPQLKSWIDVLDDSINCYKEEDDEEDNNSIEKKKSNIKGIKSYGQLFNILSRKDIEVILIQKDKMTINLEEQFIFSGNLSEDLSMTYREITDHFNLFDNERKYIVSGLKPKKLVVIKIDALSEKMAEDLGFSISVDEFNEFFNLELENFNMAIKMDKKEISEKVFDKLPKLKLEYLKQLKSLIDDHRKAIDALYNRNEYTLTDGDKLIMEVGDE